MIYFIQKICFFFLKVITGYKAYYKKSLDVDKKYIFFANHQSHFDTLIILSALSRQISNNTSPCAAEEYWNKGRLKKWISSKVFKVAYVSRVKSQRSESHPMADIYQKLDSGRSIIIFPEGTRNTQSNIAPFKSGIYHLAKKYPDHHLVPVYVENLSKLLPKGEFIVVPTICNVYYGNSFNLGDETKQDFLKLSKQKIIALKKQSIYG